MSKKNKKNKKVNLEKGNKKNTKSVNKKQVTKNRKGSKNIFVKAYKKTISFIKWTWEDDSIISYIFFLILTFVFLKFLFFPFLSLVLHTKFPIVAVVSGSMQHKIVDHQICNLYFSNLDYQNLGFNDYWKYCGAYYEKLNISKSEFERFQDSGGLNIGDVLILHGENPKNIKVGDIIVFIPEIREFYIQRGPVIHRVVKKWIQNGTLYFATKGDHNPRTQVGFEDKIPAKNILGTPILRIPYIGLVKVYAYRLYENYK